MKTLDEVIESITTQSGLEIRNVRKPERDRFWVDRDTYNDALHYLKMYRSDKIQWEADRKLWADKQEQVDEARQKYIDKLKELEIGTLNDPLTWDELKQMEGKPVWVEYNLDSKFDTVRNDSKNWGIIGNIQEVYYDRAYHNWLRMAIWTDETLIFAEEGLGTTWQAYRKERSSAG